VRLPPGTADRVTRKGPGAARHDRRHWLGKPVLNPATLVFAVLVLGWRWGLLRVAVGAVVVAAVAQRFFRSAHSPGGEADLGPTANGDGLDGSFARRYPANLGRLTVGLVPEHASPSWCSVRRGRGCSPPCHRRSATPPGWPCSSPYRDPLRGAHAGEIPIIATLVASGLAPAAAGALLVALPAVSLPSLLMVGGPGRPGCSRSWWAPWCWRPPPSPPPPAWCPDRTGCGPGTVDP
jgi:hypothetical protein